MKRAAKAKGKGVLGLVHKKSQDIDLSDIPEVTDWSKAVVGKFYRPIKKSLTIRIDADVLAWLKGQGKGYQTKINGILREAMGGVNQRASKSGR
jgi:uncharacterized protein (DUF4415 family)